MTVRKRFQTDFGEHTLVDNNNPTSNEDGSCIGVGPLELAGGCGPVGAALGSLLLE